MVVAAAALLPHAVVAVPQCDAVRDDAFVGCSSRALGDANVFLGVRTSSGCRILRPQAQRAVARGGDRLDI
eukprot:1344944-Prymnesium_polylepis.2